MQAVDHVLALLDAFGARQYGGEAVSQLEHALQCAALAEADGAEPAFVAAALLHDIGHLVDDRGAPAPDDAEGDKDTRHEERAALYLGRWFGPAVTEPIRLHVAAKRYLVATDPAYAAALSPASQRSLALQGGAMRADEARAFAAGVHAEAAIRLRRLDDIGKVPGAATPRLEHFRPALVQAQKAAADRLR